MPVLERVLELASDQSGLTLARLSAGSAIAQDIKMYGGDVEEFAKTLGFGVLPALAWQIVTWPFRGSFEYPSKFERLELRHIAAVIEKGEWFDP